MSPIMDWPAHALLKTFGVHALWLSCWACFAGELSPAEARRRLMHDDVTLMAPVIRYEFSARHEADPIFPPGPRAIAQELPAVAGED